MSPTPEARQARKRTHHMAAFALAIALLALLVASVTSFTVLSNRSDILDVKSGRRVAVIVTCAANSAVIEAGRKTIQGSPLLPGDKVKPGPDGKLGTPDDDFTPGPLSKRLEADGYPGYQTRLENSRKAGNAYAESIAEAVRKAALAEGVRVPNTFKNGKLDCGTFQDIAQSPDK